MGADIHLYVEVKLDEDRWNMISGPYPYDQEDLKESNWEALESDDAGIASSAYFLIKQSQLNKLASPVSLRWLYTGRNYGVFSILANVRNGYGFAGAYTGEGYVPISSPKGIPDDASWEYLEETERWGGDGHSHSYFTLAELDDYDWDQTTHIGADVPEDMAKHFEETGEFPNLIPFRRNGDPEYRRILQPISYRETAQSFLDQVIPGLEKLRDQYSLNDDEVRIVFFFDN